MILPDASTPVELAPRQQTTEINGVIYTEDPYYTREGYTIKWAIFLGLCSLIALWLIISYIHVKKRIRKGLAPLAYHRWMVHRNDLARVDPRYAYPQATYHYYNGGAAPNGYGMNSMAPPPPMYDPSAQRPPVYEPPVGATKVDPSQFSTQPTRRPDEGEPSGGQQSHPGYAPPPGPPPPVAHA